LYRSQFYARIEFVRISGENESGMEQYIGYLYTSRQRVTQLGEKQCTAFWLNLVQS
jgi:hypothetical protein